MQFLGQPDPDIGVCECAFRKRIPMCQNANQFPGLVLGTATFGVAPRSDDVPALVRGALERGITSFDTANSYGNQPEYDQPSVPSHRIRPSSEELLGRALRGIRDEVHLASKVGEPLGRSRVDGPFVGLLTRDHIVEQLDLSLRRLGTDRLDLYYAHLPDLHTPLDETVATFNDLITQGKIRAWGISNYSSAQTEQLMHVVSESGARPPATHQVRYSLAERDVEDSGVTAAAQKFDIPMLAYSPLAGGLLAGRGAIERAYVGHRRWGGGGFSDDQIGRARRFASLADDWGVTPSSLALAWLFRRPGVAGVVVGTSALSNLDDARRATAIDLDDEQLALLDALRFAEDRPGRSDAVDRQLSQR
ncbi:aldo/keto reductase [Gordonia mangrovi]|nr:aldo/keto reductase [Gordonia mangrovi]UVF77109.1 aldo/keto reductase [Gordonia mangrovi]